MRKAAFLPVFFQVVLALPLVLFFTLSVHHAAQAQQATEQTNASSAESKIWLHESAILDGLKQFTEGEILIIERCLAALYYYPNQLTGVPGAQLAAALFAYMQDRPVSFKHYKAISKDLLGTLITDGSGMDLGGSVEFRSKNFIKLLEDGDVVQASGLWENEETPVSDRRQEHERIVCVKSKMVCNSVVVRIGAPHDTRMSSYNTSLHTYAVERFDNTDVIALTTKIYSDLDNEPGSNESSLCSQSVIRINLVDHAVTRQVRHNPDKAGTKACPHSAASSKVSPVSFLRGYSYGRLINRYRDQKTVPVGQKEKIHQMLDAQIELIESYLRKDRK